MSSNRTFRQIIRAAALSLLSLFLLATWDPVARAAENVQVLDPVRTTDARRIAIVIGNGEYDHILKLKNPAADAKAVSAKLSELGFEVVLAQDVGRRRMNDVINSFLTRIQPGNEALVYYSGHGVELNGSNYLLPTDVPETDQERMLREEGINLTDLLLDLQTRNARVNLVIVDACRDNLNRTGFAGGSNF